MQIDLGTSNIYQPDYELERSKYLDFLANFSLFYLERCSDFIAEFNDPRLTADPIHDKKKYMRLLVSNTLLRCISLIDPVFWHSNKWLTESLDL